MHLLWSIYKKLAAYSNYISYVFIIIYLYEFKGNLDFLLIFALVYSLTSPIGHILGNIITIKLSPKLAILIANFLAITQTILLIYFIDSLQTNTLILIALIAGISSGIKEIAEYLYQKTFEYYEDPVTIQTDETVIGGLVKLAIILPSVFFVSQTDNFTIIFVLLIISISISSIIILKLNPDYHLIHNSLKELFRFPKNNPKIGTLVYSTITEGLFESINATIIPVTLFLFAGNILNWGLVNATITAITVGFGFIYFNKFNSGNYKFALGIVTFLLASTSILIVSEFNILVLIVYILLVGINDLLSPIGYKANFEQIIDLDPQKTSHLTEYKMYENIILSISKSIPLLILLYFKPDFSVGIMTQTAIVFASLLPFITFTIIGKFTAR